MKRVVLTGATGFVGSNLCRRLLSDGHEVHLLLREGYGSWRIEAVREDTRIHLLELTDAEALLRTIASIRPDWIFHLAAYGAYASQADLQRMVETNVLATATLVDVCLTVGCEAFVNTGSSSEYGLKDHAPSEGEAVAPNSVYGVTKAAGTHYCLYRAGSATAAITTLRLYSAYGPYEEPTRLVPTLIVEGLRGRLPPLVNGSVARDFVYIVDVLDAYLLAASNPATVAGKIYNVGTGVQTSIRELVDVACAHLPITAKPEWGTMEDRAWDTSVWIADPARIEKDLGWRPRYSIADGFRDTVDWLNADQDLLKHYQGQRNLPR